MQQSQQRDGGHGADSPSTAPRRVKKSSGKGTGGRNRPRASLACSNCRERKTKCTKSADPNTCVSCNTLRIPCVISHLGDRRRIQSREQFSELQDRVHLLETLLSEQARNGAVAANAGQASDVTSGIQQQGLDSTLNVFPHQNPDGEPDSHNDPTTSRRESQADVSFTSPNNPRHQSLQQQTSDLSQQLGPADWPGDLDLSTSNSDGAIMGSNQTHPRRPSVIFPGQSQTSPDRLTTISTDDDAPRLECDQDNGQPRFYGPTSQLHIRSHSMSIEADAQNRTTEIKSDSNRVQEILIQSFWESQPLSQAIIERSRYDAGRRGGVRCEYWSPFLENALLACASRMRTSPDIRALGPRYCEGATSRIVEELASPQISTIQGFLLLSDFEATRGRDRLGYLYCGIGCRMVFDLGLHESCAALIAQGRMTISDKISRHLLFLGSYVYDTLWGLYLGRPSTIPPSILRAAQSHIDDMNWSIPVSLEAWVGMSTEIAEATEVLNSNAVPLRPAAMDHLLDLDTRISRRLQHLPSSLTFDGDQISELAVDAYGLHVQLRGIRIVLHKRLSQTMIANANAADSFMPNDPALSRSRAIMHDCAVMIARLTSTYQRIFGIENVITVMLDNMFVAAALLVTHVLNQQRIEPTQSTESDVIWLHCLSDMFQRAQKHYPVTARMLSTLSNLTQGTVIAGIFGERTQNRPLAGQTNVPVNDILGGGETDWSMGLGGFGGRQDGQQDTSNWFLDGLGDTTGPAAPDMDPRNMMTWLLSPMEL